MRTKLLKVKTHKTELGDLEPIIADHLPKGVNLVVLEYEGDTAIVKLTWSEHPLAEATPSAEELNQLLSRESVIEEVSAHPLADKLKVRLAVHEDSIEHVNEVLKEVSLKAKRGTVNYLRKEASRDGGYDYVLDEG